MRLIAIANLALAMLISAYSLVRAGDTADVNILGFSADGRIFAFEEYGVQDGSGFPYAHRYYIDTVTDRFVAGTPIRVRLEDENDTVSSARAQARTRGEKVVRDVVLGENRGHTVGFNAITELSADPYRMAVNPRPIYPPVDDPIEFRLQPHPVIAPERCDNLGEVNGFALTMLDLSPGGRTRLLHKDETIPLSRGCPNDYRIGAVQTFFPDGERPAYAVLISISRVGFEGPDHRWIASTGRL